MLENTAYNSPHIRPLAVRPLTHPENGQTPGAFSLALAKDKRTTVYRLPHIRPLEVRPLTHPENGRNPGAFFLALAKVGVAA